MWRRVTRDDKKIREEEEGEESPSFEQAMAAEPRPVLRPRVKTPTRQRAARGQGDYADIDRRTAERFRKGKREIEATLDLHGMTRDKAQAALTRFLARQLRQGRRTLLIITGKGKRSRPEDPGSARGILASSLPGWLSSGEFAPYILAFDHAQNKDGGSGAFYVLLRRQRDGKDRA